MSWKEIKPVKGWRRLNHQSGYLNECTGQTLIITKKQFSSNYYVLIFVAEQTDEKDGKIISPNFSTESKAEAYALKLMNKHTDGIVWLFFVRTSYPFVFVSLSLLELIQ